jgi:aquaporin rerated protein, other eukaryote
MDAIGTPMKRLPSILPGMNRKNRVRETNRSDSPRLAAFKLCPRRVRGHVVAMTGEFVGTFLFLLFALGGTQAVNSASPGSVQAPYTADPAKLLYIALFFGFFLAVNAWIFFRISGGFFNPAVSEDPVNI